ncbi:hypothetical protein ACLOJK_033634 [Asimina triloba]
MGVQRAEKQECMCSHVVLKRAFKDGYGWWVRVISLSYLIARRVRHRLNPSTPISPFPQLYLSWDVHDPKCMLSVTRFIQSPIHLSHHSPPTHNATSSTCVIGSCNRGILDRAFNDLSVSKIETSLLAISLPSPGFNGSFLSAHDRNPLKKMRNLVPPDPAADAAKLRFELEDPSMAAVDSATLPGIRHLIQLESEKYTDTVNQKYKADMARVPEDRSFVEFDDVPVEGFGTALLADYGWKEAMGIGRSHKEDVKIVQYVP